jgi:2-keto-3-deoxy-L-rhamnonate aldolase RhmA
MTGLERIKRKIEEKQPVIGTHTAFGDAMIGELLGLVGFDFVWIDMEHTAMSKEDVLHHIIAVQSTGAAAFVRVPAVDPVLVKPVLEMGPSGIVFPNVKTQAEAELAVRSCLYPPRGIRGFGPIRASLYGLTDTLQYIAEAPSHCWRIMQIEHAEAVDNLRAILGVEGVDAIVVGSNDLSGSIGLLGQTDHPDVTRLMDRIGEIASGSGKPFGVSMGYNPQVIREWRRRGISWIGAGGDTGYLLSAAREALNGTREILQ